VAKEKSQPKAVVDMDAAVAYKNIIIIIIIIIINFRKPVQLETKRSSCWIFKQLIIKFSALNFRRTSRKANVCAHWKKLLRIKRRTEEQRHEIDAFKTKGLT